MPVGRPTLHLGHCEIDLQDGVVCAAGEARALSPIETALLRYLVAHPREVVTREQLLVEVWGYRASMVTRTVDNTVGRLRARIERDPAVPELLLTVPGSGYRFMPPAVPGEPSALIGRGPQLARLRERLGSPGLRILVGPAGVGKTALAREVSRGIAGVCWVDLGHACSADELLAAVAGGLGLALPAGVEAVVAVGDALGGGLLVADAIDRLEPDALALLAGWSRSKILATSRQRVALRGAEAVPVGPLASTDAVELYRRRAEVVLGGPCSEDGVAALVEHLDRLPLAIELAAAHAMTLGPIDLSGRLAEVLLEPGAEGDALLTALSESFSGLAPDAQRALGALCWFSGRFDLADAEALLGGECPSVWRVMATLTDRCLLVVERDAGRTHYRLFEVVRAFTRRRPEAHDGRQRHLAWALMRGEAAVAALAQGGAVPDATSLGADLLQAVEEAGVDDALRLRRALHVLLLRTGPAGLVRRNADRAVELAAAAGRPEDLLQARLARAEVSRQEGRFTDALADLAAAEAALPEGADDLAADVLRQRSMVLRLRLDGAGARAAATAAVRLARSPALQVACRIAAAWTDFTWRGPAAGLAHLEEPPGGADSGTLATWNAYRAVLLVELRRDEEARAALAQAGTAPVTASTRAILEWSRAALFLEGGGDPESLDRALAACRDAAWRTEEVYVRLLRVLAAVDRSDLASGHAETEALLACAGGFPDAGVVLLGSFAEALLAWRGGDERTAREVIARARRDLSDPERVVHDDPLVAVEAVLAGEEPPAEVLARSVTARLLVRPTAFGAGGGACSDPR
ncbi:MAG: winged helix-turn-helix domain-containing protein [Pseudomonadota bacterium]